MSPRIVELPRYTYVCASQIMHSQTKRMIENNVFFIYCSIGWYYTLIDSRSQLASADIQSLFVTDYVRREKVCFPLILYRLPIMVLSYIFEIRHFKCVLPKPPIGVFLTLLLPVWRSGCDGINTNISDGALCEVCQAAILPPPSFREWTLIAPLDDGGVGWWHQAWPANLRVLHREC